MTQSPPRKITKLYRLIISLFLLAVVLITLYVVIARQAVIWVSDYRIELQEKLSKTLHDTPVTIGDIKGSWDIFSPTIILQNIHIGTQKQMLEVDQLTLELDVPSSILNWQLRIDKIHGENLTLQIRENNPNDWSIGGIPKQKDPITPEIVLSQLQRFKKLSISNSTISIHPYQKASRVFTHINATLTHFSDEDMRLDGILYINDDKPLTLSIDASINPKHWYKLKGKFYANVPYINWRTWLPENIDIPWKIDDLTLGGQVWGSVRKGELQSLAIDTKNSQIAVNYQKNNTVSFKDITMQAWFNHHTSNYTDVQIKNLSFNANQTHFQNDNLRFVQHNTDKHRQWDLQASTLNIENTLTPILALAPIPQETQQIIHDINPKGNINNLHITWLPDKPLIERLKFSAEVENVSFNPYKETVGSGNISGKIQGGINEGTLALKAKDFSLFIAALFNKPWHYKQADSLLNWSFDGEKVSIFSHLMQLKADEGDLTGDMMIRLYPHNPIQDYMDLRVNITNGDASYTPKYIPSKAKMSKELVHWLNTAIIGGDIENGYFQFQGSLNKKTPSTAHALLLYMKVNKTEVNYQQPWLPIRDIAGEVFIQPSGVKILAEHGTISNTTLEKIKVNIPLNKKQTIPHLYAKAELKSTVNDTLHVLKNSPRNISEVFTTWQGQGVIQGQLQLDIPLEKHQEPLVITDFKAYNASLNLQYPIPPLMNISGDFNYNSQQGLSSKAITATVLGNPVQGIIEAEGKNTPISHLKLKGIINIAKLINWYFPTKEGWPIQGTTPYNLDLLIAKKNQLTISSTLKGIEFDLPAPFNKTAKQTKNISFQMDFGKEQPIALKLDYGTLMNSVIAMDKNGQNWRGELLLNQGKASLSDKQGLQVRGNFGQVNIEEWYNLYNKYLADLPESKSPFNSKEINNINLLIGKVVGFNIPPQQAAIYIQPAGNTGWQLNLNSPSLFGRLTAPQTKDLPYYIHLNYLKIPETLTSILKKSKSDNTLDLSKIPSISLSIQQLFLGDESIGSIRFDNAKHEEGLKVSNIALNLRGVHIHGDLDWKIGKQTTFTGKLFGKNLDKVLANWNVKPSITADKFSVVINGTWKGSPTEFSPEHFTGTLSPELKSGRILSFDESTANILRIFGILNLEAVTRQLRLDFSDFYKPGLAFNSIKGELKGDNGLLTITKPILLEGPSMMISMSGNVNMQTQQVDAIVKVGIPLASSISIATLAVTPPIGGAMLVADYFLGNELMKIAAVSYSVKGDWNNPVINRK